MNTLPAMKSEREFRNPMRGVASALTSIRARQGLSDKGIRPQLGGDRLQIRDHLLALGVNAEATSARSRRFNRRVR